MTRRAWWLVGLNILVPGSAQMLAGNRKLGRFGVGATFTLWAVIVLGVVLYFVWPTGVYTIATTSITLWVVAAVLLFYAVLWVILTLDTLRLTRIVKTLPSARAAIAGLATVAMVLFAGGAGYAAYLATTAGSFVGDVFSAAPPEPPVDGRYNIMLLGADAGPDREGLRPDSITVVSIDAATGEATMIGLPRNLEYVPFAPGPLADKYPNGYGADDGCEVDVCYLNSVYTEVELMSPDMYPNAIADGSQPGIEAMRDAVSGVTGLTIQYYVLIEMQGFIDLVDSLGGVDVTVENAVPIHTDETFTEVSEWIGPGVVHLDGWHALWYARSRHDTTDYDRMERQHQLQEAILEQSNPANVLSKFQAVAAAGARLVETDIPQSTLGLFVELATKTKELPITRIELTPAMDVDPEYPDYDYIHQLVADATVVATPEE
ncbi:LCP family protein required for cell wall assembly [Microbacteriaceae bacterium SG_E_30_P1]|uniref:LCP family protein required for cell wall assembly n=1 Tax=Antiquaquibacter oligotrophicus TaxID=2880260 RepID=A0ABT6KQF4_9MICO|nr:LCP family protein [Antiquaquibacter oligotrophicus]MDH6181733.1 LCP family protein required for cell wall assembly [Antiquaquibacter oligotrophicus]UDF12584.1 LCP family protein [Antiquaquibacter oligotrophicus]